MESIFNAPWLKACSSVQRAYGKMILWNIDTRPLIRRIYACVTSFSCQQQKIFCIADSETNELVYKVYYTLRAF